MQLLLTATGTDFSVLCRILPFDLIHNKLIAVQFKSTGRYVMTLQQWPKPVQIRVFSNDKKTENNMSKM